jgi:hypothetical protein
LSFRSSGPKMEASFIPMRTIVSILKKHGSDVDEYEMTELTELPLSFHKLKSTCESVTISIRTMQDKAIEKTKVKTKVFLQRMETEFKEHFMEVAPYTYTVTVEVAQAALKTLDAEVANLEIEIEEFQVQPFVCFCIFLIETFHAELTAPV